MLKVRAEKVHEDYLESLAKSHKFRVGFLLGAENVGDFRGVVVHMAAMQFPESDKIPESILDITGRDIVLQAINLTRMLPGGFVVLGLFVVHPDTMLDNDQHKGKLTETVKQIQEQFRLNPQLMALQSDENDFLVLSYSSGKDNPCVCQAIHTGKSVEFTFEPQGLIWRKVETYFGLDDEYCLEKVGDSCNIEGNLQRILGKFQQQLDEAFVFRAGSPIEDTDSVDMLFKKDSQTQSLVFAMKDTADLPDTSVEARDGTLLLSGSICCRVFVPKGTKLQEVVKSVRKDIIRSLAARLQLYCDTLPEGNVATENLIDLHTDNPRRIFFTVQPTGVQFSDYLFAGEDDDTVRENVSKLMDINLEPTDIFLMVEEVANDTYVADDVDSLPEEEKKAALAVEKADGHEIILKILALLSLLVALVGAYMAYNQN